MGCPRCSPQDPAAAWEARATLGQRADLLDESHLHIRLLGCQSCGQEFASVFSERVDWADGDDPQYWCLIPVTPEEADALAALPPTELISALAAAGTGRQVLHRDAPKGAPTRVHWATGLRVLY